LSRGGTIAFRTFIIPISFLVEFYQVRRFLKGAVALPERASEKPFVPVSKEKFEEIKKEIYRKII
jgi:hypothetical protein